MHRPESERVSSADLAAKCSAEGIPKQGDHERYKEKLILYAGTGASVLGALHGLWFALAPQSSPTIRTMAAGWVGVVLGQAKKVWGN